MQAMTPNEMTYTNTQIADEKTFLDLFMEDEMDEMGFLDMGFSLELSLTGDFEDL